MGCIVRGGDGGPRRTDEVVMAGGDVFFEKCQSLSSDNSAEGSAKNRAC
ncbi:hypothetical protein [Bartonella sp. B1098]|nr:hypothetical protein [Bartonella sp. B1098]